MDPRASLRTVFSDPANRRFVLSGAVTVVVLALIVLGITAFGAGGNASKNARSGGDGSTATEARGPAASGGVSLGASSSATLEGKTTTVPPSATGKSGSAGSQAGGSSSGGSGSEGGSESGADPGTPDSSGKIPDIRAALPTAFSGYSVGVPSKQGADAVVSATPSAGGSAAQRLIWAVHDRGSASAAKTFVSKVSRTTYEVDSADVKVRGVSAYYGTDGMRFATVVFVKGQYVFEVLGTAASGDPGVVRSTVLAAAQAFPVLSAK